ncbi:MAG: prepilin-type N-terminal cleavage/methylation domain-containing protein [Patescibacteria group bacterium]
MKRTDHGFTLIELILVILIILALTGFITANYAFYTEEKKLNDAATRLRTILIQARTRTMNGDLGLFPCDPFEGYQVSYTAANPSEYTMTLCCNATCSVSGTPPSYEVATYDLPGNVSIVDQSDHTTVLTNFQYQFYPSAEGTNLSDESTIVFKNTFINSCNWVTITPLGVVEKGSSFGC